MPLDPQLQPLLDQMAAAGGPSILELEPGPVREGYTLMGALAVKDEVGGVSDGTLPGPDGDVPIRIYTPHGTGPFPALVFFHGGGWTIGNFESHDGACRSLCARAEVLVIAVDYRLAPEHKFPAAVDDAEAAFDWVREHAASLDIDPDRIAVGGDSAGGNLAAVVAQARTGQVAFQLLIYPAVDATLSFPSIEENAAGPLLTKDHMTWFSGHYLDGVDVERTNPRVSPIHGELAGAAPAFIMTAEFDPLRDEGEAYAKALSAAGVEATVKRYAGMPHAFVQLSAIAAAADAALDDAAAALRKALE